MLSNVLQKIQSVLHQQEMHKNLEWMDTLTEMDGLDALKMTTDQLVKIQFDSVENLDSHIEVVLEIDKKSYHNVKKITYKFLKVLRLNKKLEEEMYNAAYSYQRQLYVVYMQFLDLYLGQNKTVFSDEKINLILCRQLNATFAMAKWRYFDDQPAPAGTWANVCKVIKCAENLSLLNTNVFLYEHQN